MAFSVGGGRQKGGGATQLWGERNDPPSPMSSGRGVSGAEGSAASQLWAKGNGGIRNYEHTELNTQTSTRNTQRSTHRLGGREEAPRLWAQLKPLHVVQSAFSPSFSAVWD